MGLGGHAVEDIGNAGLVNVEGILLTFQVKEEVAGHLEQIMLEKKLQIPYDP